MIYIAETEDWPSGYIHLSTSANWTNWLSYNIPPEIAVDVRNRLRSNLKHLIVGLELKAALIEPHQNRGDRPSILFQPYFQNLILEFCIASFSIFEGLGAAHWLHSNGQDGADSPRIHREKWLPVLCAVYDKHGEFDLKENVENTLAVRDKLHQDRLGAREQIDWHDFGYEVAYAPARRAIQTLLRRESDKVPARSNLSSDERT